MSSARFARLVQDAYAANDINAMRDAANEYYCNHCLHPIKLKINDSHTGHQRTIFVGCGKCIHCQESKINEWCTRMYAHAEDFKNVYFVTLTYRSITDSENECNKLILSKLSQAVWHRDAYNQTKHYSYSPCLLVKAHYQNFLKRLRKNTGLSDLTYVLSGEYGSKFGRPHFHLVLFTNGILTHEDVQRAWSVCLWRNTFGKWSYRTNQHHDGTPYNFPIGRVDFHDLVRNGTFNTSAKIKVDGTFMNASNCFSYVCKYVVKRDKPNLNRVYLAYRELFHKDNFVKIFDNEISYKIAKDYLIKVGYKMSDAESLFNNQLKKLQYEKTIYQPAQSVFTFSLNRFKVFKISGVEVSRELLPESRFDFDALYSAFCEFSRGTPIGSVYAKRNLHEFTQGVFTRPLLQSDGFVVPSYFRRKARNYVYGFREVHKTFSSKCFALGCLPNLLGLFQNYDTSTLSHFPYSDINDSLPLFEPDVYHAPTLFHDLSSGEYITFDKDFANHYKYSRSSRKYVSTRSVPVADFIRYWCARLQNELALYSHQCEVSKENLRLRERALLMMADYGDSEQIVTERFESLQKAFFEDRNKSYISVHSSAE